MDVATAHLVRLVLDDAWAAAAAAAELRARVPDPAVLRRVRSRVARTLDERASEVGDRALATLDLALAVGQHTRGQLSARRVGSNDRSSSPRLHR